MTFDNEADIPIRAGLAGAVEAAWARLAQPGTWWNSEDRIAIAAEARQAMKCGLCLARKDALSPQHVDGAHDTLGRLGGPAIDAIHRIRTDAGRLTEKWYLGLLAEGLKDTHYVEIVGIVATVSAIDTFDRAMGLPLRDLPPPIAGAPSRHRPAGARPGLGWLDTLAPEDVTADDPDPFSRFGSDNIQRALSLVPEEVIAFFELDVELYFYERGLPQRTLQIAERALSEEQIEMMAARAAAINGCYY